MRAPGLEEGVNEWGGAAASEHDEDDEEEEDEDDGGEDVVAAFFDEEPEFVNDSGPAGHASDLPTYACV